MMRQVLRFYASFLKTLGAAQACGGQRDQRKSTESGKRRGYHDDHPLSSPSTRESRTTHVDAVHEVEELFDAILAVPSLAGLDLVGAVLEVLCGLDTLGGLALLSDGRCDLKMRSAAGPARSTGPTSWLADRHSTLTSSGSSSSSSSSGASSPLSSDSSSSLSPSSAGASACALHGDISHARSPRERNVDVQ